jgi:hypothetical protein
VYASVYSSRLTAGLAGHLPARLADAAHSSVGAALGIAAHLSTAGQSQLASAVHAAAASAFTRGLSIGCLVAGGVAAVGAVMAAMWLPAQPGALGDTAQVAPELA